MPEFLKSIFQTAFTNVKYIFTSAQNGISKYFQELPIWTGLALLFFAYLIFVSICLPIFAIVVYSLVLGQIQAGWNVLLGFYQYHVLSDLVYHLYQTLIGFYYLNIKYPPMPLGWQLKYFFLLLLTKSNTLITFHVTMIFHSFALARFQFWASAIMNKQSVPVKRFFSVKQFIIDTLLFAFLAISFGFFNGGGDSAAFFLWGIATFGNILGFSAKI